jgi:hypothetical protein
MRDPSIHVKRSDLKWILKEFFEDLDDVDINRIVGELRKYSCDNRSVTITNDKLKKDLSRRLQSKKGDAMLLSEIIYSVRIRMKHKGVRMIKENDREWLQLKELTKLVNQFCEDFNLEVRAGYIKYVEMCFSKISSLRSYVSKFISMYESICNEYDAISQMTEDDDKQSTLAVHDYFVEKVADKTGIVEPYTKYPNKMIAFYKVRKICDELGVEPEVFIDAQFDALDWCQGMPTPENLISDKSRERLNKYMYQNNISVVSKTKKDFWNKLKSKVDE